MTNGQLPFRNTSLIFGLLVCISSCTLFKKQADDQAHYPTDKVVTPYHNEWTVGHYQNRIKAFQENPLDFGDIVFIGNSITEQGKNWNEKFGLSNIKNRGISGDVTDGVLARLDEIVYYRPKAVFLLIGINDLSNYHQENESRLNVLYHTKIPSPKYVADNIIKIAAKIHQKSPKTKVFVQTVLPNARPEIKESIDLVNAIIKENESKQDYQVIDLHQYFTDQRGLIKKELTNDGTHLNEQGYAVWVAAEKAILHGL
ncbi:GDSL family lipase [Echinicola sp. CAU 1574]|uniref:GDSL family lipase n=1 Tax=Echinicola arenosa TaxID=2774144 RepID=A0ABR9ALS7_9BACT|nr:GDSL-type esterase/lipase family protein [Echinicola arenosa]MBD8489764.1 GDSL family lipase [Echinicola arenosa]